MSTAQAFDQLTEELSGIVAKELAEGRETIRKLSEEHAAKLGELRTLRETYRRQQADAIRREVSAARAIDRETIDELRQEVADLRRQVAARATEYSR